MSDADPHILTVAGDVRVIDFEVFGHHRLPSGAPCTADLARLCVVPTTPEFLVIDDHKSAIAEIRSASIDLDALVIYRNRDVATGHVLTRHERRAGPTSRRIKERGSGSRRKAIICNRQGSVYLCSVYQIRVGETERGRDPQRNGESPSSPSAR